MNIWAHRGCSYNYPENTLSAFRAACNYAVTGIELDIQMTKDGEIVVIHDERVERTTDGIGAVADMTLQELKSLKIIPREGMGLAYETVPAMREVLELLREFCLRDGLLINIELKNSIVRYEGMEQKILQMVREFALEPYVIYSSFNPDSIQLLKQLEPSVKTGILNSSLQTCLELAKQVSADALHPYINQIDVENIRQQTRLPVRAWNVRPQEPFFPAQGEIVIWNLLELENKGITDIFTNGPETYVPKRLCEEQTPVILDVNYSINADTGYAEKTEAATASSIHFCKAPAGSLLHWKNPAYCYQLFLYSMETEPSLIYTYCYQREENWATYLPGKYREGWRTEDYLFPEDCYFRIMVKKIANPEAAENQTAAFLPDSRLLEFYQARTFPYIWADYFREEAARTAERVQKLRHPGDLVFLLLADTHYVNNGTWEDTAYNLRQTAERIRPIGGVIHLGDFTDGMLSLDICREYAERVLKDLRALDVPLYLCVGNHDSNYFYNNPEKMSEEEMSRFYLQREKPWYFVDCPGNKLRMLFLYSFDYREQVRYGFPVEELEWVRQTLADTETGWSVLVFAHVPPLPQIHYWSDEIRNGEALVEILEEYHTGEGHRIMAYIHGHNHADQIYQERAFPIISIGCNKLEDFKDKKPEGAYTPDRKRFTVTQELWDVMIVSCDNDKIEFVRFGAGEDRTVELSEDNALDGR